jgi:hypothetical protein
MTIKEAAADTIHVTYRKVDDYPVGYTLENVKPGAMVIKPGKFPGMFGYKDLHITHIQAEIPLRDSSAPSKPLLIIAMTNQPLTSVDNKTILRGAIGFLRANRVIE